MSEQYHPLNDANLEKLRRFADQPNDLTDAQTEKLGRIVDEANTLKETLQRIGPDHVHSESVRLRLTRINAALKDIYRAVSGKNPWEESQ